MEPLKDFSASGLLFKLPYLPYLDFGFVLNLEPYESWVSPGYHISPSFIIVDLLSFKKTENNFKNLEQNLFFNVLKLCPNFGKIIGVLPGANTDSWLLWDWPVICWFFFFLKVHNLLNIRTKIQISDTILVDCPSPQNETKKAHPW